MENGELKNRIDSLWQIFWTGGLTNPLDIIEQITYLMFIHGLDDMDNLRYREAVMLGIPYKSIFDGQWRVGSEDLPLTEFKWSVFKDRSPEKTFAIFQEGLFPFIKQLHGDKDSTYSKYMDDAIFKIPTPQKLAQIIDSLDEVYKVMGEDQRGKDIRGDVYEYLLSKISTSGTNGQFRTPRHIIEMMVNLMDPVADDMICDPSCGTAGFLVAAGEYLRNNKKDEIFFDRDRKDFFNNQMFTGYDLDRTMLRIGAMNMMSHGIDNPNILYKDSVSKQNEDRDRYSLILANPPFKGSLDSDIVSPDLLAMANTKKTELLFVALFIRLLRIGGRCASIVPDGVLFGSSKAHKSIRKAIVEEHRLQAVISMPSGVFKPYAGVSTAIIIFTKTGHGGTDKVWFYDMKTDGYSLDDKRSPIEEDDIPDIIARFRNLDAEESRDRTEQSFMVTKDEIVSNDYDLSINKYKKVVYEEEKYPPSSEIIAEMRKLVDTLSDELKVLEEMIR